MILIISISGSLQLFSNDPKEKISTLNPFYFYGESFLSFIKFDPPNSKGVSVV